MPVSRSRPTDYRAALLRRRALGVLVLAVFAAAAILLWERPNPFVSHEIVHADVADADGLAAIGADVRVAGVPVGKVTGIARSGNVARLTLTLDSSVGVVHRDATVALRPRMLFEGTAYAQLTLGSPSAPALGQTLIPVTHTSTYVPLDDALSVLDARGRANTNTVAGALGATLSGAAPAQLRDTVAVAPSLTHDAAVVAGAARGPHATELGAAVSSYAGVASAVASRSPALRSSVSDSSTTLAAVNTGGGQPLSQTLSQLPVTAADLASGATAAARIVARLQTLVPRLQPGVEQLTPTLNVVRPLLVRSVPVLDEFSPVLGDAETAVTGARRGAAPALRAVQALQPTLEIFNNTLIGALQQKTDLGDPAYLAFLGLFAGGGGASRPFGVNGQGHFMRFGLRFLTGVGLPLPPCSLLHDISPTMAAVLEAAGGCTP